LCVDEAVKILELGKFINKDDCFEVENIDKVLVEKILNLIEKSVNIIYKNK
jgi:hypothetical protein